MAAGPPAAASTATSTATMLSALALRPACAAFAAGMSFLPSASSSVAVRTAAW